jgi:Tol biopolymer transport system component
MRVVMTDIAHDRSVNVSNAPREPVSSGSAYDPSVSGDVRRVGFESIDQSGSGRSRSMALWLFDRAHASTQLIAQGSFGATYEPRISAHGSSLVFSDATAGRDGRVGVYARSHQDGTTVLASRANGSRGAIANADSSQPTLSADGRFVAFASAAPNLGRCRPQLTHLRAGSAAECDKDDQRRHGVFAFDPAI